MSFFARHLSAIQEVQNNTPATMSIPGREQEMARNNNGGFSFVIDAWSFYDRFLIIGPQSGNNAKDANLLADEGIALVKNLIKIDAIRVLSQAVQFSLEGRAPKNDSAIIAIALVAAYGNSAEQVAAYEAMLDVCRTGTHLFLFVQVVNQFGKWNAAAKRGVAKWYTSKQDERLAVQLLKYQNRNGWSHRDVLRLGHVKPQSDAQNAMFRHVVGSDKTDLQDSLPELFEDVRIMNSASDSKVVVRIINGNSKISWEMVPTQFLNDPKVLEALLPNMGMTALIRQLGRFSANGLTTPLSNSFGIIRDKLSSVEAIKNGRVHPITILTALKSYQTGHGRSGASWNAERQIVDMLDAAFYNGFKFIEDTGANVMLGIDCSGSMFGCNVNNSVLTAAEVAACMAMAVAKSHKNYFIGGFSTKFQPLAISPNMGLDKTMEVIRRFNWSSTNISSVAQYATSNRLNVDVFGIITDNDVNCGIHPTQALNNFRRTMSKNAAQIVCATSMSRFTVADPIDPMQVDITGFDSHVPAIFAEFEKMVFKK